MKLHKNQSGFSHIEIFLVVIVVVLIGAVGWMVYDRQSDKNDSSATATKQISNFDECAAAGNPIMETYPEQCAANGKTFVKNTKAVNQTAQMKYFEIKDWNIKFDVTNDHGYYYTREDNGSPSGRVQIFAKDAGAIVGPSGENCGKEYLAIILRYANSDPVLSNPAENYIYGNKSTQGDYTYFFTTHKSYGPTCFQLSKDGDYEIDSVTSEKFEVLVKDFVKDYSTLAKIQ